jgi:hypothetical protein
VWDNLAAHQAAGAAEAVQGERDITGVLDAIDADIGVVAKNQPQ